MRNACLCFALALASMVAATAVFAAAPPAGYPDPPLIFKVATGQTDVPKGGVVDAYLNITSATSMPMPGATTVKISSCDSQQFVGTLPYGTRHLVPAEESLNITKYGYLAWTINGVPADTAGAKVLHLPIKIPSHGGPTYCIRLWANTAYGSLDTTPQQLTWTVLPTIHVVPAV